MSEARCRLFAYGPADVTAIPKPHHLLPHLNPNWFYLSGTGLPRLSWKRGRQTCIVVGLVLVVVVVVVAAAAAAAAAAVMVCVCTTQWSLFTHLAVEIKAHN